MFNRYWRTYPWVLQMALAFLTIFTLMSFSTYLILVLVPKFTGANMNDLLQLNESSPARMARISLFSQAIGSIGTFVMPALLFAGFAHPRMREYLGLRLPGKRIHWVLVTGIMLGLIPVLLWGEGWMIEHVHLGKQADDIQHRTDGIFKAYLKLPNGADFALLLTILALIPAIGEELIFRGIFLRLFHRRFNGMMVAAGENRLMAPDGQRIMVLPVIVSTLLFAFWHTSPYGFVFIFIAGCVLALIYFMTGSLLCSMWAHFLYNGFQITFIFNTQQNEVLRKMAEGEHLPIAVPLVGLAVFLISFYALIRNQMPLQPDWSTDFKPEEE